MSGGDTTTSGVAGRWRDGDLPASTRLVLDASVRRVDGGRALIGGSPLRIVKLSAAGAATVDRWEQGEPVGDALGHQRLARRLLDGGLAHPRSASSPFAARDVTVVVAVHDDPARLEPTLVSLAATAAGAAVVVADDASPDAAAVSRTARRHGATVVRRDARGGPAANRNHALARVTTPVVALVDRDVVLEPGWLDALLAHLADPRVAIVAPRVRAAAGPGALARFDRDRSPLDLGPVEARVAPGTRVAYVPTTALVVRRSLLDELGGFDESLTMGEDVDLVWRAVEAGHTVRYEPRAVARHPARTDLRSWLRQRYDYGTSAAPLDERHPGAVAPLSMSGWTALAWALAGSGHPVLGAGVAAGAAAMLPARLTVLDDPWREAWELAGKGQLAAWRPLSTALVRTWWPLTLAAATVSRRARWTAAVAVLGPPVVDWIEGDRSLDPLRATALRVLDDAAYGTGVWAGCLRTRRWGALRPTLRSWPGRRRAVEPAEDASDPA